MPRPRLLPVPVIEVATGVWRWSTRHQDWEPDPVPERPADRAREVGSVLFDAVDATVFVDPFVPDRDPLWEQFDEHVEHRSQAK